MTGVSAKGKQCMLGLWPAERGAFWEAVSCGQSLWGDAVWLIGLSWSAHKALCPWLIHPALHGQIKGEGHHGGVFWGESFFLTSSFWTL